MHTTVAGTIIRSFRIFHPSRYAWHEITAVPEGGCLTLIMRDITDVVRARETEAVRDAVRQVIDQAPVAISLMRGPDHRVDVVNAMARQLLGGKDLEGRSIRSALPELEGQGLFELLDQVYRSGEGYKARGLRVKYDREGNGMMYEGFFDVVYQPVWEADGKVSGVLSVSVEVADPSEGGAPNLGAADLDRQPPI